MLKDSLEKAFVEDFKNKKIEQMEEYALENKKIVSFCYNSGILESFKLDIMIRTKIFERAKEDYKLLVGKENGSPKYAENLENPEYLAYGLYHDLFSSRKRKKIQFFEDGQNEVTFLKEYNINDLEREEINKIINPRDHDVEELFAKMDITNLNDYALAKRSYIEGYIREERLGNEMIENVLEEYVIMEAMRMYKEFSDSTKRKLRIAKLGNPPFFIHALDNNVFSKEEEKKTDLSYTSNSNKFIKDLRKTFLNPLSH